MSDVVELDQQTRAKVERLASLRKQGVEAILREAVSQLLDREEARTDFQNDALEAWADFQTNGLHATFAEVDRWLARLEQGEEAAPPECHV